MNKYSKNWHGRLNKEQNVYFVNWLNTFLLNVWNLFLIQWNPFNPHVASMQFANYVILSREFTLLEFL